MDIDNFNPNDPRIQLLIAKEHLKFKDELNLLQSQLDLKKQELSFLQEAIKIEKNRIIKKKGNTRSFAILASIVFLISTLLIGFGISMLTSTTPNSEGWLMIILGSMAYFIGTIMANLLAIGDFNK